ncbi:MAG: hypothetical protein AVDCRST_MAG30-424 [uncultured Solirubrobacteraceae bacterium]|uniref:PilZ domain-containing protein n=1 Tax=uncultured Solirubrobacteraceae bacterium TaxID=1162706 RepID=A0A6J4RJP3_9ACTN|nr:MAG: hypothetical protein AVDCRST_MAG30-424 [uncultured Solirubrobacteraceae bacterium]
MPPPTRAQHVLIRLPDGDSDLQARVDAADEDTLTLVLASPPEDGDLRDRHAIVEYTTPLGVYRLSGELSTGPEDGEADVVHLRRDGHQDVVQRRDFKRVDAVMPIQVMLSEPVRGALKTTTLNISGGGLLVQDPLGLEPGTTVDITLDIARGTAPIRAIGRVVRAVAPDEKGIQIEGIAAEDRERLVRYVTERERLALRISRGR